MDTIIGSEPCWELLRKKISDGNNQIQLLWTVETGVFNDHRTLCLGSIIITMQVVKRAALHPAVEEEESDDPSWLYEGLYLNPS